MVRYQYMKQPITSVNKKLRPLTYKQKAFIKHIIDHPKESATKAVLNTYGKEGKPPTYMTARQVASENMTKPSIVSALAAHNQLIENTIINTINEYKDSEKIQERTLAVDSAFKVHDKIHGKAKQQIDVTTTGVTLNLDLSSALPTDE